jgi:ubiquinone/menaquinone biosynthesis C-methylase UbiE
VKTEELGKSKLLNMLFKPAGSAMESGLRRFLHDPVKILRGADIQPGQTVLEVGSGTGFFTITAARLIGDKGCLIAMDPLSTYVERLKEEVEATGLRNVQVVRRDALDTGLEAASIDKVLLFGVLPFPSLPLNRLLPEMHRVLKPNGTLAVWMFPIAGWVPGSIRRSTLFTYLHKRNGVYNYRRSPDESWRADSDKHK